MTSGAYAAAPTVGTIMKARQLIDGASVSFGPEAMKAIGQAFDQVWVQIAGNFGSDPIVTDSARLSLANAILTAASDSSRDVETIKKEALNVMAQRYQTHPMGPGRSGD